MEYELNELQDFEILKLENDKDLHPVFSTVLDTFSSISAVPHVKGQVYLWDVLQTIKFNFLRDISPEAYLTPKFIDGKKNSVYDGIKAGLPAICYNARFHGYKKIANCKTINNLMFLDIDDFGSKREAQEYKTMITEKYDWILACNLSLSKMGLHIIAMVDQIIDNNDFNIKYDYISTTFFEGKLDNSSKSISRYTVVPYDHDIYINEHPITLNIENTIRGNEKGIRSAYISDKSVGDNSFEKGLCSGGKKEIISTAYTFFSSSPLKEIMNDTARENSLRFRPEVDESLITDPDIPLYFHEGIDVVSINLFPYRDRKVLDGSRTIFLGSMTVQMLYLNVELPEYVNPDIRTHILKFIMSLNNKICKPPLPFKEVLNSYNANWRKYEDGKMIFSRYFKKQRAFWSANTSLKGNEKRKVTCRIKNEPIVAESRRQIREAIKTLIDRGEKVTQKRVAEISEIRLSTVKKYRKYYKEIKQQYDIDMKVDSAALPSDTEDENHDVIIQSASDVDEQLPTSSSDITSDDCSEPEIEMDFENPHDIFSGLDIPAKKHEKEFAATDKQIEEIYDRIFSSIKGRLNEQQKHELHSKFVNRLNGMKQDEVKILSINIDDINDTTTYWKQSALDIKFLGLCDELFGAELNGNPQF